MDATYPTISLLYSTCVIIPFATNVVFESHILAGKLSHCSTIVCHVTGSCGCHRGRMQHYSRHGQLPVAAAGNSPRRHASRLLLQRHQVGRTQQSLLPRTDTTIADP